MKGLTMWFMAAALLPGLAWAQPTPQVDFSGSWALDEQLSLPMDPIFALQGVPWALRKIADGFDASAEITQSNERLTVTFSNFRGVQNQVLVFDGQPHATVNPAGLPTTMSTTWSDGGTVLVASGPVEAEGASATLTERRSLSPRGDLMTVQVQVTTPGGQSATTRRVYRKQ